MYPNIALITLAVTQANRGLWTECFISTGRVCVYIQKAFRSL